VPGSGGPARNILDGRLERILNGSPARKIVNGSPARKHLDGSSEKTGKDSEW
jgi:hypothetical protein